MNNDEKNMRIALLEAEKAYISNEVPIGAVIICNNKPIAKGFNQTELLNDVTAHAEIIAITSASNYLKSKYLKGCTLYVTLEPCIMCAGALMWTQIDKVVFGAYDKKRAYSNFCNNVFHPKTKIIGGVLEEECSKILQKFFKDKRS